jgi:NADPH:quinone reductase-like Zn-dependent oxidoreductase
MRGLPLVLRAATGLRKPKDTRLGIDGAGRVEAIGKSVTRLHPGDEVFGACKGAFAEYAVAPESSLAAKPAGLSFEQAAAVPVAGSTALQGLRDKAGVQAGQRVLIHGAAGGVGTFAVQIAKTLGAEVTAVCSTRNVEMVRSLGADRVVDYTREDFTASEVRYDVMLDMIGVPSLSQRRRALTSRGTLVLVGATDSGGWLGPLGGLLAAVLTSPFVSQRLRPLLTHASKEDLQVLAELLAAGKVRPVIDRTYPLSEVPEAIRYLEQGHARGKVVIRVAC